MVLGTGGDQTPNIGDGSLIRARPGQVPKGAIMLTEQEVVSIQVKTMRKWEPKREMYVHVLY